MAGSLPGASPDRAAAAEAIFAALLGPEGGEIFLDVPQPNRDAVALAVAHGLAPARADVFRPDPFGGPRTRFWGHDV
jgi:hypothetical protein